MGARYGQKARTSSKMAAFRFAIITMMMMMTSIVSIVVVVLLLLQYSMIVMTLFLIAINF